MGVCPTIKQEIIPSGKLTVRELENLHAIGKINELNGHCPVRFLFVYQRVPVTPRHARCKRLARRTGGPATAPVASGQWPWEQLRVFTRPQPSRVVLTTQMSGAPPSIGLIMDD